MRLARIHIYFGTTNLPNRELGDQETGHDTIDIEIGEGETVKEVELVKQGAAYIRREETGAEFEARVDPQNQRDNDEIVRQLGGIRTPTQTTKRTVNERVKGWNSFRYRVVTLEEIDHVPGEEVQDATVVGELPMPGEGPAMPE